MTSAPTSHGAKRITQIAAPLRQELLGQLRAAIASGQHKPGERLVERVLCEQYGVSRTVVREVLRQLETEGLVSIVPNRGPVVAVLSAEDAAALFEVRAVLEALAAEGFATRASDDERAALRAALEGVEAAFATGEVERWLEAKDSFYEVLLAGSHNALAHSMVVGVHARIQLLRGMSLQAPGRLDRSLAEVRDITELATGGKAEEAFVAAKKHVQRASEAALSQLPDSPVAPPQEA